MNEVVVKEEIFEPDVNIKEEVNDTHEIAAEENGACSKKTRAKRLRKSSAQPLYSEEAHFGSDSDPSNGPDDDPEFNPKTPNKEKPFNVQNLSGFSLFCQETQDTVKIGFPDLPDAKINAKLSHLWSELPGGVKRSYTSRAKHYSAGRGGNVLGLKAGRKGKIVKLKDTSSHKTTPIQWETEPEYLAFCCGWGTCDYQFEIVDECADHITDEHLRPLCHSETEVLRAPTSCRWRGCQRRKRCSLPFLIYARLSRHMSEEHVLVGKSIKHSQLSQNYICRREDT